MSSRALGEKGFSDACRCGNRRGYGSRGVRTIAASLPDERVASSRSQSTAAADATSRIVISAQAFLNTLDEAGRADVQFPFDSAQKTRWSNLPSSAYKREGARTGNLTAPQHTAAMTLLQTALSESGARKIIEIMRAADLLRRRVPVAGMRPGGRQVAFGADGVLPRVPRRAVDDVALDVAIRRSSPRDQPDVCRLASHARAQPHRCSPRQLHVRGPRDPAARERARPRVCVDGEP